MLADIIYECNLHTESFENLTARITMTKNDVSSFYFNSTHAYMCN